MAIRVTPRRVGGCGGCIDPCPRGMNGLRLYADVHRTREGCRITHYTDGITFRHVDSFAEIPAGPGDQVFVDTIPIQHTDGG